MATKHPVHKYFKARLGTKIIYRCAIPNCRHYLHRELVTNQMSLCWRCNLPFVLPKAPSLLTKKPWCPTCTDTRKVKKDTEIPADILGSILGGLDE